MLSGVKEGRSDAGELSVDGLTDLARTFVGAFPVWD